MPGSRSPNGWPCCIKDKNPDGSGGVWISTPRACSREMISKELQPLHLFLPLFLHCIRIAKQFGTLGGPRCKYLLHWLPSSTTHLAAFCKKSQGAKKHYFLCHNVQSILTLMAESAWMCAWSSWRKWQPHVNRPTCAYFMSANKGRSKQRAHPSLTSPIWNFPWQPFTHWCTHIAHCPCCSLGLYSLDVWS